MKFVVIAGTSVKLFRSLQRQRLFIARGLSNINDPVSRLGDICKSGQLPETFNFATDVFDIHTAQNPSKLAFWMENDLESRKWSFAQFANESIRAAISLQSSLKKKQISLKNSSPPVLVILPRVPEWWFIYLATIRLGAIFCPGTCMLSPEDIAYRMKSSGTKVVVTNEANMWKVEKAQRLENIEVPVKIVVPEKKNSEFSADGWLKYDELTEPIHDYDVLAFKNRVTKSDALAQIFFTSGTTGKPKMVAHSHATSAIGHFSTLTSYGLKPDDIFWCLCDPGWAKSSYGNFFPSWIIGSTVYVHQMERYEPRHVLKTLCERPITGFCAPPTLFRSMVLEKDDSLFKFNSVNLVVAAGEALNDEVVKTWKDKTGGLHPCNLYGQTETTALTQSPKNGLKPSSMGVVAPGFDMRIVDDDGNELPVGKEGNIAIKVKPNRPVGLCKGYLKNDSNTLEVDENSKSFVGDYYLTGDLAYTDDEGNFYYVGRTDDVIISAGYRIGPFEVESVLQTHPAVAENAVVAFPDPLRGDIVKAFIVLTEGYKTKDKVKLAEEIQAYFKKNAAPYKYPRKIQFVDVLPKTISGKILRRELRNPNFLSQ